MSVNALAMAELEAAVEQLAESNVRMAKCHVRRAVAELGKPIQSLPGWVKPGVCVELDGEPGRAWRVVSVNRGAEWSIRCEDAVRPVHNLTIFRERGPRHWSRCRGMPILPKLKQELPSAMVYPHRSGRCRAGSDGDCDWPECPQVRDGEPEKSGRSCPLLPEHEGE